RRPRPPLASLRSAAPVLAGAITTLRRGQHCTPIRGQSSTPIDIGGRLADGPTRLFGISQGQAIDAVAAEIVRRWPDATNMDYFPGRDRYRHDRNDRYEYYREHVQRHAAISAGTRLSHKMPVVRSSYDTSDFTPWDEWLARYDLTFKRQTVSALHAPAGRP
ncbi:hypothetical protein, partial [Hyphomicrobium sp. NDB2Meth4]|uniref:hypothetical protein n=1 Tax=Hyphomicrobium sp. NDB2Meth4 TaxID=1892846 RepID=UPI001AECA195